MYHVPWIALFSANRWRLDVSTFLIIGFGYNCNKNDGLIFLSKANPSSAKALADRIWDFLRRLKTGLSKFDSALSNTRSTISGGCVHIYNIIRIRPDQLKHTLLSANLITVKS